LPPINFLPQYSSKIILHDPICFFNFLCLNNFIFIFITSKGYGLSAGWGSIISGAEGIKRISPMLIKDFVEVAGIDVCSNFGADFPSQDFCSWGISGIYPGLSQIRFD